MTDHGFTAQVAEFASRAQIEEAPQDVLDRAKLHLLDAVGIMLGGVSTRHPVLDGVTQLALESAGRPEATLVGAEHKVACPEAAMANAVLANFLDFSDGHFAGGHINDRLVPVCLAVGERTGASGRDVLMALLVGYEVYIRLATALFAAVDAASVRLPYFTVVGPLAGAAAAGRLLGLSPGQIAGALGLAASFQVAGAQYVHTGGQEKDLCPGHEARRAVVAALLAERNVLGSSDILEGEHGLLRLVGADTFAEAASDLGNVWRITECYFKPYPACRYLHASIEAALRLREQGMDPSDIEAITITTNSSSAARSCYDFHSHVNAIFSHPYQVAVALVQGRAELPTRWSVRLRDPLIASLMRKVQVQATLAYDDLYRQRSLDRPPWPAELEVVLRDGSRATSRVLIPKGDPANPLAPEEVRRKFATLAGDVLTSEARGAIVHTVDTLETCPTITTLTELLTDIR